MKDECSMLKLQLKEKDELISQLQEELVSDNNTWPTECTFLGRLFVPHPYLLTPMALVICKSFQWFNLMISFYNSVMKTVDL